MDRGNLITYDDTGKIFSQSGDASGEIQDHVLPRGMKYIVVPYGKTSTHKAIRVDVTDPENHFVVFEEIEESKTYDDLKTEHAEFKADAIKYLGIIMEDRSVW